MAIFRCTLKLFWVVLWLIGAAVWLSSCSQSKDLKDVKDPFYEQWRVKAEESKGHSAVEPPPVDEPPFEIAGKEPVEDLEPEVKRSLPTRKISLKMNSIEVSVLLRALAKAANQNIILNEKVTGKINININQAPWDQVFQGILRTHGLSYAWEGEIIRIMTAEDLEADIRRKARTRDLKLTQMPITRIVAVKFMEAVRLKDNLEKFVSVDKKRQPHRIDYGGRAYEFTNRTGRQERYGQHPGHYQKIGPPDAAGVDRGLYCRGQQGRRPGTGYSVGRGLCRQKR